MLKPLVAACVGLTLAAALPVQAQRNFTAQALRGELQVTQPPAALLNGKPVQLAPGARIRDEQNLLLVSAALAGRKLVVYYTLEPGTGHLQDVWVLTRTEAARKPWPTTAKEAQAWQFNEFTQTWTKP